MTFQLHFRFTSATRDTILRRSQPFQHSWMIASLIIPPAVLQRSSSWCLDIVAPTSRRSSCFTSGYGKYMRGTGSVLLLEEKKTGGGGDTTTTPSLQDPHDRQFDPQWAAGLGNATVRYFSGAELTRLMGLASSSFSFPPDCTTKQQWKLVGNSVHVDVVAKIVQLGQWVPGCTEASMDGARLRLRRSSRLLDTRAVAIPNDIPPSTDPSARRRNQVEGFRA